MSYDLKLLKHLHTAVLQVTADNALGNISRPNLPHCGSMHTCRQSPHPIKRAAHTMVQYSLSYYEHDRKYLFRESCSDSQGRAAPPISQREQQIRVVAEEGLASSRMQVAQGNTVPSLLLLLLLRLLLLLKSKYGDNAREKVVKIRRQRSRELDELFFTTCRHLHKAMLLLRLLLLWFCAVDHLVVMVCCRRTHRCCFLSSAAVVVDD